MALTSTASMQELDDEAARLTARPGAATVHRRVAVV